MAEAAFDPTALLSKPVSSIIKPVRLPIGAYLGTTTKYEFDKARNEKASPLVRFTAVPTEALPDVDQEQLAASLKDGNGNPVAITERSQRLEFWLTPDALHRLKTFAGEHCGVPDVDNMNVGEMIQSVIGQPFMFILGQSPNKKNPEEPYINIDSTGPVPE